MVLSCSFENFSALNSVFSDLLGIGSMLEASQLNESEMPAEATDMSIWSPPGLIDIRFSPIKDCICGLNQVGLKLYNIVRSVQKAEIYR